MFCGAQAALAVIILILNKDNWETGPFAKAARNYNRI